MSKETEKAKTGTGTPPVVPAKSTVPSAPAVSDEDKLKKAASPDDKAAAEKPADAKPLTPEEVSQAVDARDQRERRGIDQRPRGEGDRFVRDADLRAGYDRERPLGAEGGPAALAYSIMVYSDGSAKVTRYATEQVLGENNVVRFKLGDYIGEQILPDGDSQALYSGLGEYCRTPEEIATEEGKDDIDDDVVDAANA